jgi:hypothetical protein
MRRALFSLSATKQASIGIDAEASELLKGSALLYPQLVLFAGRKALEAIAEEISSGVSKKKRKEALSFLESVEELDPRWVEGRDTIELVEDLGEWLNKYRGQVAETVVEELLWDWLFNRELTEGTKSVHPGVALSLSVSLGIPYHDEKNRAERLVEVLKAVCPGVSTTTELTATLPLLGSLSWDQIWELRASKYIDRYRLFMRSSIPVGASAQEISEKVTEALWSVVGKAVPSPSGSALSRVVGTIPVPLGLPNPLALYKDVRDGLAERSLYVNYGWVFFMQEARELGKPAPNPTNAADA